MLMEREDEMLCDKRTAREDVAKQIDKLKKSKSPGPNEIFQPLVKES